MIMTCILVRILACTVRCGNRKENMYIETPLYALWSRFVAGCQPVCQVVNLLTVLR